MRVYVSAFLVLALFVAAKDSHVAAQGTSAPSIAWANQPRVADFLEGVELISGGREAGKCVWLRVGGKRVFDATGWRGRGVNMATFKDAALISSDTFNTSESKERTEAFARAVETLPAGTTVILAVCEDGTGCFSERGQKAIESIGGRLGLFGQQSGSSYFCIGVKGLSPGIAVERAGRERLEYPSPFAFQKTVLQGGRPSPLVAATVRALDAGGKPVVGAAIYAWCPGRGLSVPWPDAPACFTDSQGIGKFCALAGDWTLLGVCRLPDGDRGWAVCRSHVVLDDTASQALLKANATLQCRFENLPDGARVRGGDLYAIPTSEAPHWMPSSVGGGRFRTLETNTEEPLDLWWDEGARDARRSYFLKASIAADEATAVWDAAADVNARLRVPPFNPVDPSVRGWVTIDNLEFCYPQRPIYHYFGPEGKEVITTPAQASVHWTVGWDNANSNGHSEEAEEHLLLRAGEEVRLEVSQQVSAHPVLDRVSDREFQYWLNATDGNGHRLHEVHRGHEAVAGKLELLDEKEALVQSLPVRLTHEVWQLPAGQRFPSKGTYRLTLDFGPFGSVLQEGAIPEESALRGRQEREHMTLLYPAVPDRESQRILDELATTCADDLERLVCDGYNWYGITPPRGIQFHAALCPPTAGGSAGSYIVFHLNFLERWDTRRWDPSRVAAHELGHSMHCIEPLHVFLEESDKDSGGTYNESQATFMGCMGLLSKFGPVTRDASFLAESQLLLDWFRGTSAPGWQQSRRLFYLSWLLQRELGDDFCRRYFRLAHADPPDVRNRIRSQSWSATEKICALYSSAAGQDLSERFREMGFEIRPGTGVLPNQ
ncbi:MAG: interleukin-like EMT inducer domain-containing protein [Armatimonadia bacterium]